MTYTYYEVTNDEGKLQAVHRGAGSLRVMEFHGMPYGLGYSGQFRPLFTQ